MSNILVINASGQETRVALIEQGTISEYYLERKNEKGIVGNIYKGKVVRVLPGMQAAFVDIGLDKAAFLYVGDIVSDPSFPGFSEEMDIKAGSVEGDPLEADDLPEPGEEPVPQAVDTPPLAVEAGAAAEAGIESAAAQGRAESAAPVAEAPGQQLVPPEPAAGAPAAEPAEIVELHPDDAIEDEEGEDQDDEEEELDEADAAHAAAEEALAAEQAQADSPGPVADAAQTAAPGSQPQAAAREPQAQGAQPPEAGARGLPADQRPAAREGRRGRRRGGRGRRRGGGEGPRPAGEQPKAERRQ